MNIPWGGDERKAMSYKKFKDEKFEKSKTKVSNILKDISICSLKEDDKQKLISEIKAIVANF